MVYWTDDLLHAVAVFQLPSTRISLLYCGSVLLDESTGTQTTFEYAKEQSWCYFCGFSPRLVSFLSQPIVLPTDPSHGQSSLGETPSSFIPCTNPPSFFNLILQRQSRLPLHPHHAPRRPPHPHPPPPPRILPPTLPRSKRYPLPRPLARLLDLNSRPHSLAGLVLPLHHGSQKRENRSRKAH